MHCVKKVKAILRVLNTYVDDSRKVQAIRLVLERKDGDEGGIVSQIEALGEAQKKFKMEDAFMQILWNTHLAKASKKRRQELIDRGVIIPKSK